MIAPYYADRSVRIYLGDSREIMPALFAVEPLADCTITDPAYDKRTHAPGATGAAARVGDRTKRLPFAALDDVDRAVCDMLRFTRRWCIAFCTLEQLGAYQQAAGDAWVRGGVWHRLGHAPQRSGDRPAQACEGLALAHKTDTPVSDVTTGGVAILHPPGTGRMRWNGGGHGAFWEARTARPASDRHDTEKPLDLMRKLVSQFTMPGDKVLDPYMGSGTTLRACKDLGRQAIGIELDERWCEVAARRMAQECLCLSA